MSVEVVRKDPSDHPSCTHGPTLLFLKHVGSSKERFYACSACRSRKDCSFYLPESNIRKYNKNKWKERQKQFVSAVNHHDKLAVLREIRSLPSQQRLLCYSCDTLLKISEKGKHDGHSLLETISDHQLDHPLEILPALEQDEKEAQYLFSQASVDTIVSIFKNLGLSNIICIGTPKIHEHIQNNCEDMSSILLDFDKRFHNFYPPTQFGWYNLFNHHFFLQEAKEVFEEYLKLHSFSNVTLIMDPPFGGRLEPISISLETISKSLQKYHGEEHNLLIFLILPYFMEPHVSNYIPELKICDYKVEYKNHSDFQNGPEGKKYGSIVRIFTNAELSLVKLPEYGYKYCKPCNKWVSKENTHCAKCNNCTSKNGSTYKHCSLCKRCVKSTWQHCKQCKRCALVDHTCKELEFTRKCFHCQGEGHKRAQCPLLLCSEISDAEMRTKGGKRKRKDTSEIGTKRKKRTKKMRKS
ncbi:unnamed protein product [Acanthoscelides obtectus]|uniref:Zinc finger CCHC domain-containing protein 4 n=1 Tax=Acanthoscelides obtectus TaxID=200917 RepID=A0A9P0K3Y9_ACAOB|nr:unnamed protein product [Acanthoscelides obtectus]CAK1667401.1 Zinc finger CCHC domain-containing protein 4 [Acanthoscelides obtectus]